MDGVSLRTAMRLRLNPRTVGVVLRSMVTLLVAVGAQTALAQSAGPGAANPFDTSSVSRPATSQSAQTPGQQKQPFDIAEESGAENPLAQPLVDIRVEGNTTIPEYVILQKVKTRSGRPASQPQITEDVRALYDTRWFTSVAPVYQQSDEGLALVFRVVEKPVVNSVRFSGNKKIKTSKLEAETGLRTGAPFDVTINKEAVQRIRELYLEKGYRHVKVGLKKGGELHDRDVHFEITEGPKVQVRNVSVAGNTFARDGVLELGRETKPRWWWPLSMVGGKYDPETIPNDEIALTQYYQGLGFFDVEVTSEEKWVNREKSLIDVVFTVKEGRRFKVRNVLVEGEQVVAERKLREPLKLVKGEYFNARHLATDVAGMKENYDELGRLYASVNGQPIFLQDGDPGYVDLLYTIDEDKVYYIGDINIGIRGDHPHTSEDVVRNMADAYIQPGSLANAANIRRMQSRLMGSHLWERSDPPSVNLRKVEGSDYLSVDIVGRAQSGTLPAAANRSNALAGAFGHSVTSPDEDPLFARFQNQHSEHSAAGIAQQPAGDRLPSRRTQSENVISFKPIAFGHSVAAEEEDNPTEAWQQFLKHVPQKAQPRQPVVEPPSRGEANANGDDFTMWEFSPPAEVIRAEEQEPVFRAQSPDYRAQSMDSLGNPVPQDYLQGVSPQGDPYGNALRGPILPGFVDVDIDVTEARTGRLMFGVGVNSDAGVVGNIVLEENNFDITRPPRSFADILNGQAWRGGGQSFRIEAVPGNEVSRYLVSWQDPFFMNTDFSLGTSGFYYTRFYQSWNEQRLGGRITLGRLLGNFWSLSGAVRLENVNMSDISASAPPILAQTKGDNFLSTGRVALAHDTRDSSFLPTQGHFVEGSYEQAFGDFVYPRFEVTGSQFFTAYERPDGRGKHIVQLRGQAGWTGGDTPIFERFYAGGFQSFRGFAFRGVSPIQNNVRIGGEFMMLGTAEYIIPITADDNIRGVVFSDFGTVEETATLDQFRASVGAGLRLIVPAMGPAPIALDFAFPVLKENFDDEQVFSFYVGFTR